MDRSPFEERGVGYLESKFAPLDLQETTMVELAERVAKRNATTEVGI